MTLSVGGTIVVEANGKIQWARISNPPTLYYGSTTTRANTSLTNKLENIEVTGSNIRCYAKYASVG